MFRPVNPKQNFPGMEDELNQYWKKNEIFIKSIKNRSDANKYVFYDGPPFITGTPHYGSLLPSIAKDVVPRYQTMKGKRVERVWGWDCHGLPIETKVEKNLGIKNRREIENFGIQKFVDECYNYTRNTSAEWKWYVDKIGRWVDFDNSYKTMDQNYMESVIWVFKQLMDKGLVYEGTRVSLFCTRCGTPVSNFEIAMDNSYAEMEDPAVTVKFPIISEGEFKGINVLAWTTTPWTVPSNRALVLDPKEDYIVAEVNGEKMIVAKKRADNVFEPGFKTIREFKGEALLGLSYDAPFHYVAGNDREFKIYAFEGMVTMEEGTGIVHSAPGFGEIDTEMGKTNGLQIAMSINDEGKYIELYAPYTGMYIKDADPIITEDLRKANRLFKSERIKHRYPFCYRCATPLIQKAQPSWYINIGNIRNQLVSNNDQINWVPDHLKEGRFRKGIETAPDWGVSRTRFWATPMPIWQREENGKVVERVVIGSRDELRALSTTPITKITFARHGERIQDGLDGMLTENGLAQAKALQIELSDEQFDCIFTSPLKRTFQTVQEISTEKNLSLTETDALGSADDHEKFIAILKKICTENNVEVAADAPEEVLKKELAEYIATVKTKLDSWLSENSGKTVLAATHLERIAMLKHIYEGKTLKECLAMTVGYGKTTVMYFRGAELLDLHRPKIDEIKLKGQTGELTRVKEVLDVWMDSASMPYASRHYPFENKADFEANYPADYVVEYIAQTRAWFYVMHVISSALFDKPSFKNVVTTGVIFGTDGRKMSKSYGNYPDPKDTILKYGAEPLRLYLMGSKIMVGEDINFDEEGLKEQLKTIILPLWNSYSFLITYANMKGWTPRVELALNDRQDPSNKTQWNHIPFETVNTEIDKWILAKLQLTIRDFRAGMDEYNIPSAVKTIPAFIDDMSKWFIRRSRDRFANNEQAAFDTLYYVLVELVKLMAPITPFLSETIYQNLVKDALPNQLASVHLCDLPEYDMNFLDQASNVLGKMDEVRDIVTLGQSLRVQNNLKVRQPLAEIRIKANEEAGVEREMELWMKELIKSELNIKDVWEVSKMVDETGWVNAENSEKNLVISINTNLTEEMLWEGIIRELVRGVQNLRKKAGLQIGDEINLELGSSDDFLHKAVENNLEMLKAGVKAHEFSFHRGHIAESVEINVNKIPVYVKLNKLG